MVSQIEPLLWEVTLHSAHRPFDRVLLRPAMSDLAEWPVVQVRTDRLIDYWERDGEYLAHVGQWPERKRSEIQRLLDPARGIALAPQVTIVECKRASSRFLRLIDRSCGLIVSVLKGRHPTRFLAGAGAKQIVVQVHKTQRDLLLQHCG